jgi:hypothetical protein
VPLTTAELSDLAPKAITLSRELAFAFGRSSQGGKKLTKAERRQLANRLLGLATALIRDLVD